MPEFKVSARQAGNSVEFEVTASDIKEALKLAKEEAREIFDYKLGDGEPNVAVKIMKEES